MVKGQGIESRTITMLIFHFKWNFTKHYPLKYYYVRSYLMHSLILTSIKIKKTNVTSKSLLKM